MKGNISLKKFIKEVKDDLRSAVDEDDPFFLLGDVELEVSFGLDIEAGAGAKFVVFDIGSKAKAQQSHKIKIKLTPFIHADNDDSDGTCGGDEKKSLGKPSLAKARAIKIPRGVVMAKAEAMKKPAAKAKKVKAAAKKAIAKKAAPKKKAAVKKRTAKKA